MIDKPSRPPRTNGPADGGPRRLTERTSRTPDQEAIAALVSRLPSSVAPDDLAVERVWRRVMAPPKRAAYPRAVWVAAAMAVAAVLMLVVGRPLVSRAAPAAEVALTAGGVFSSKPAERWHTSSNGEALGESDRVRTDATGRLVVRMVGIAAVLVRESTDVALERIGEHGTFLRLSHGTLTARVEKRKRGEAFVIETDRYAVKVVGTLFTVEEGPGDHTAVSVREGVVEVSDGLGRVDRVVAGQRWTSEAREVRGTDRTSDAVKTVLEDGLKGQPSAESWGALSATVTSAGETAPAPTHPSAPITPPDPSRASASVAAGGPSSVAVALPRAVPSTHLAPIIDVAPAPTAPPPPPATDPVAVPEPPAPPPAPSASAPPVAVAAPEPGPYARGLALESRGDLEGAAQQLSRAANEDAAHGDIALYALGRLAQRRLHDSSRASAAYHLYRTRYPHGALLPEVDLAILELEVDGHSDAAALADSTRFLAAHPTSERVDEVHLLRGNLLRDVGSCTEALVDYAAVHTSPFTDHAVYSTAYCQRKLGDRDAAAVTLRAYLTRFPGGAHRAEAQRALAEDH